MYSGETPGASIISEGVISAMHHKSLVLSGEVWLVMF